MARFHGKTAKVYLYSHDVSGDLSNITISAMADVHDSTTFASAGAHESDPGLLGWEAAFDAFYDPSVGGIGRTLETLLGASGSLISVYEGSADAIGDHGVLLANGVLTKREQPISASDLIKLKGTVKSGGTSNGGRPGLYGVLLHVLGAESTTADGTSVDNGASSANGGRANLHITAATGTGGVITIEDSADDVTYATIATFTTASSAQAQTVEVSGTVRRYIRAVWTINLTSSLTFVVGFSRY